MLHVDDYLDSGTADRIAKEFLEHARRPAEAKDHEWLKANAPWCTWRGERWRCVGASRLGDVWLKNEECPSGRFYDRRVDVAEVSGWERPALGKTGES